MITRYDLYVKSDDEAGCYANCYIKKRRDDETGEWVKFDEAKIEIERLKAEDSMVREVLGLPHKNPEDDIGCGCLMISTLIGAQMLKTKYEDATKAIIESSKIETKAYNDAVNTSLDNINWALNQYIEDKEDTPELREALMYVKYLVAGQLKL